MAENKRNLPYLAPLARVIPLVYDQSISYYEFLNKLYEAVDTLIDECEDIKAELPEIRENVRRLGEEIGSIDSLHTIHKDNLVNAVNEVLAALDNESLTRAEQVNTLTNNLTAVDEYAKGTHGDMIWTWAKMKNVFGGTVNDGQYTPDLAQSPKLYAGPGTYIDTEGDIPFLKDKIDAAEDRIDVEVETINRTISNSVEPRIQTVEDTLAELKAPYFKKTTDVITTSGELAAEYTWTTTYGAIKNKEFLLYMGCSDAENYLASTNCSMSVSIGGASPVSIYIGKTGGTSTSQIQASYNRKPFLRLNFMEDRGSGKALVLHEFNVSTSQSGIYDGIAQINARNSDRVPDDNTGVVITVSPQVGNLQNEAYGILFEKTITR